MFDDGVLVETIVDAGGAQKKINGAGLMGGVSGGAVPGENRLGRGPKGLRIVRVDGYAAVPQLALRQPVEDGAGFGRALAGRSASTAQAAASGR